MKQKLTQGLFILFSSWLWTVFLSQIAMGGFSLASPIPSSWLAFQVGGFLGITFLHYRSLKRRSFPVIRRFASTSFIGMLLLILLWNPTLEVILLVLFLIGLVAYRSQLHLNSKNNPWANSIGATVESCQSCPHCTPRGVSWQACLRKRELPCWFNQISLALTLLCLAATIVLLGIGLINRVQTFTTPTYDLGLFTQIFHYLDRCFLPLSTLERDGLFSHLGVHFSPILYLLLPFFKIAPFPETLQWATILIPLSGILPLMKICRSLHLNPLCTRWMIALLCLHPGLFQAGGFDFHENIFLPPLILWLFYSALKRSLTGVWIASFLLLTVKEDVGLYLVSLGLWCLLEAEDPSRVVEGYPTWDNPVLLKIRSPFFIGIQIIFLAFAGFALQSYFLNLHGEGIMSGRFSALCLYQTTGLMGILRSIFQSPLALIGFLLTPRKVGLTFLFFFVCGLRPLAIRKGNSFCLLIPFLVMNLLSPYPYQSALGFHYTYGSATFLILATALCLAQKKAPLPVFSENHRRSLSAVFRSIGVLLLFLGMGTALLSNGFFFQRWNSVALEQKKDPQVLKEIAQTLAQIPRDERTVVAGTFLTTALSDCQNLYDYDANDSVLQDRVFDLVIVDWRFDSSKRATLLEKVAQQGFILSEKLSNQWISVYEKKP